MKNLLSLSLFLLVFASLYAEITLPKVITNNMVLQRGKPVAIWGKASAGEKVSVSFANQTKTIVTDAAGNWQVKLDA